VGTLRARQGSRNMRERACNRRSGTLRALAHARPASSRRGDGCRLLLPTESVGLRRHPRRLAARQDGSVQELASELGQGTIEGVASGVMPERRLGEGRLEVEIARVHAARERGEGSEVRKLLIDE
jgi:hypothetical protein